MSQDKGLLVQLMENIETAIKKKGWKQADLARTSGIPPKQLSTYFTGKIRPGLDQVERLAKALDRAPWELLRPTDAPASIPLAKHQSELKQLQDRIEGLEAEIRKLQRLADAQDTEIQKLKENALPEDLVEGLTKAPPSTVHTIRAILGLKNIPIAELIKEMAASKKKAEG